MQQNILEAVQLYAKSDLAILSNTSCYMEFMNGKFKDWDKYIDAGNRGDTVTFDKPIRVRAFDDLVITNQPYQQRKGTISVDQARNIALNWTDQELLFNVDKYMDSIGIQVGAELGAVVEENLALRNISNTYRFFGNGITPIDSSTQLASLLADFRNYGAAPYDTIGVLPDTIVPQIVGTNLNQFVIKRNEEEAASWLLGDFSNCTWYQSNRLPVHNAGVVGNTALTLTITAVITNPSTGAITALEVSGGGVNTNALVLNDLIVFQDGAPTAATRPRFLVWTGHNPSAQPIQCRVTADADSVADVMTFSIFPELVPPSIGGNEQNTNVEIIVGMQINSVPSHRAGLVMSGNPFYLAMPKLPDMTPYPTHTETDPDTGVSMRVYYGSTFGQNVRGLVHDLTWGSTLEDEYAMRIVVPL